MSDTTQTAEPIRIGDIERQARDLVDAAKRNGIIVTIREKSLEPLAMGNVEMVVDVRMAIPKNPLQASEELGHSRPDVSQAYYGSRQHPVDANPSGATQTNAAN